MCTKWSSIYFVVKYSVIFIVIIIIIIITIIIIIIIIIYCYVQYSRFRVL